MLSETLFTRYAALEDSIPGKIYDAVTEAKRIQADEMNRQFKQDLAQKLKEQSEGYEKHSALNESENGP